MAQIYSVNLAEGSQAAGTAATVYTSPGGVTIVIRQITIAAITLAAGQCIVTRGGAPILLEATNTRLYETFPLECRYVLAPGTAIEVNAIVGGWSYEIDGYSLS